MSTLLFLFRYERWLHDVNTIKGPREGCASVSLTLAFGGRKRKHAQMASSGAGQASGWGVRSLVVARAARRAVSRSSRARQSVTLSARRRPFLQFVPRRTCKILPSDCKPWARLYSFAITLWNRGGGGRLLRPRLTRGNVAIDNVLRSKMKVCLLLPWQWRAQFNEENYKRGVEVTFRWVEVTIECASRLSLSE